MASMHDWLAQLRKRATSRRFDIGATGVVLAHPAPTEPDLTLRIPRAIEERFSEDLVVSLQLAPLLADRVTIALGLLRGLFRGAEGMRYLYRLRAKVPSGRNALNWLQNTVGMSLQGAVCVSEAMRSGDFDAITTLTATEARHAQDEQDYLNMKSFYPLREAEARILVQLLMEDAEEGRVRWIVISDVEELIGGGASPHAVSFRAGLRLWLQDFLRAPDTVVIFAGWAGAADRLELIDAAVARDVHWLKPGDAELPPLHREVGVDSVAAGLSSLMRIGLSERHRSGIWQGANESGVMLVVWPSGVDDPARWVTQHITSAVESFVGGTCAIVIPRWCMGDLHANSRRALNRAYPRIRWVPLSHAEACALVALGADVEPHAAYSAPLQGLKGRVQQAWSLARAQLRE